MKRVTIMKNILLFCLIVLLAVSCGQQEQGDISPNDKPADLSTIKAPVEPIEDVATGSDIRLPKGWTEVPGSGMRMVSYTIEGTSIDFYLISLPIGDIPSNVNRWRGQVGLPPASPQEIAEDTETFEVDGKSVQYIEIYNEEGDRGIIAAIIDLSPKYWYFTAKGTVDELKSNATDLRAFLKSLQFK